MRSIPKLTDEDVKQISPLILAYVGDAVYELAVRRSLAVDSHKKINEIHLDTVNRVKAESQAKTLRKIEERLTPEEMDVVRRGRNAKSGSHPRNVAISDYRMSTGLEALLGYLYLQDRFERLDEILEWVIES